MMVEVVTRLPFAADSVVENHFYAMMHQSYRIA